MEGKVGLLKRIVAEELEKIQENEEKKSKIEFISMENEIIRLRKQALEEIEKMQEVKLHLQKRMAEVSLRHKVEAAALRRRFMEEEERAQKLAEEEAAMVSMTSEIGIPSLQSESAMSSLISEDAMLSLPHEGTASDSAMSSLTTSSDAAPSFLPESTFPSLTLEGGAAGSSASASARSQAARGRAEALQRAAEAVEAAAERAATRTFPRVEALLAWAAVGKAKGGGRSQGKEKRSKNPTSGNVVSPVDTIVMEATSCQVESPVDSIVMDATSCQVESPVDTIVMEATSCQVEFPVDSIVMDSTSCQVESLVDSIVMDATSCQVESPVDSIVIDPSTPITTSTTTFSTPIAVEVMDVGSFDTAATSSEPPSPAGIVVTPSEAVVPAEARSKNVTKEGETLAELDAGSSSVRVNAPSGNRKRGRGRRRR